MHHRLMDTLDFILKGAFVFLYLGGLNFDIPILFSSLLILKPKKGKRKVNNVKYRKNFNPIPLK